MKYRYTKYTGDLLDEIDLEDLVSKLSDLLLSSGFSNPWGDPLDERRGPDDAGAARRHPRGAVQRRRAVGRGAAAAARRAGRRRSGRRAPAARGSDPADHRADDGAGLHHRRARPRTASGNTARGAGGGIGEDAGPVHVRGHRQGARLSRLSRAARSARLGRPQQRRPPRHAPSEHRRRGDRRAEAVRVRRHAEHRSEQHDPQRRAAAARRTADCRRPGSPTRSRRHRLGIDVDYPGPDGGAERVSELVRHGHHARLQPQHDPLRRGPVHAGQARGAGARAPDPHAVSRRLAARRAVPRLGRGDSAQAARPRARRARTTRTRAKGCAWRAASSSGRRRTCGRS